MGARKAPSMAPYGPGPGYPAPSSQVAGAAVGRAGIRGVWQMAPAMVISRFTPLARSTPYLDALDFRPPSPSHAWRGAPSIRRADHGGSARFESLRSGQANPIQSNPRLPSLGSRPAHQPCVYGMAWVGWRDHKAPWMAPYEPPWRGSRRVPPPYPRRPASHRAGMQPLPLPLPPAFGVRLGAGRGRHGICPRSPLNTRPVILRLSRRPRGH